jgi:hypothetical protein
VVKGLDVFQDQFARYADQYVLIGGTAATLAMEEAGLEFRAAKDLDIVLQGNRSKCISSGDTAVCHAIQTTDASRIGYNENHV